MLVKKRATKRVAVTLRDLAAPLFRRKRVLLVTFVSVFAALVSLGTLFLHKYESHVEILVSLGHEDQQGTIETTKQTGNTPGLAYQQVNSETELLRSTGLLAQVVLSNGLQRPQGQDFLRFVHPEQSEADRVARAVKKLATQIRVDTASKTNLIEVTYSSFDPLQAFSVLTCLSEAYLQRHATLLARSKSQPRWPQPAQSYKAALEDAEAGLQAVRRKQGVSGSREQLAVLSEVVTDGEKPVTGKGVATAEHRLAGKRTRRDMSNEGQAGQDARAGGSQTIELDRQAMGAADLELEAKAQERQYLDFLSSREQERASEALNQTAITTVSVAVPPVIPTVPIHGPLFIIALAFVLAVLFSLSTAYIVNCFDPSFHTPDQVKDTLGVTVVVGVPFRTA